MKERILWSSVDGGVEQIDELLDGNEGRPNYFRVDSSESHSSHDLIRLALRNQKAKAVLLKLTNLGYYTYYNVGTETRLVRHDRVKYHWPAVKDGTYDVSESDDIVFSFVPAKSGRTNRMVVIFSPISSVPRLARYFWQSFKTIQKYLPPDTAVLRIADLGGVKGAFYLDTTFLPNNSRSIQRFIQMMASKNRISDENIVLYGASKGGTAALFHGLSRHWKFVAVDPVVADEWYELNERDYHFTTGGIFPRSKEETFKRLVEECVTRGIPGDWNSVIITSSRSPQFPYISKGIGPLCENLAILDADNPKILEHPEVAPNTIYAQMLAINGLLIGPNFRLGLSPIP